MATWKLTVEYDGTRYYGWQEQRNARTIAGELRAAAEATFSRPVEIIGAGRTDAGVHALAQVARVRTDQSKKGVNLLHEINDRLPPDINILDVEVVRSGFDPRRDALARYYLYQISQRRTAFSKRFVWWVKDELDHAAMREAARSLTGRHDFARFCDKRVGEGSTIVAVNDVEFRTDGDLLLLRIGASHYLWKMVRRIVGALVEVGRGSISGAEFASLISSRSVAKATGFQVAAHTAPPSGLFLEKVFYDETETLGPLMPAFPVGRV